MKLTYFHITAILALEGLSSAFPAATAAAVAEGATVNAISGDKPVLVASSNKGSGKFVALPHQTDVCLRFVANIQTVLRPLATFFVFWWFVPISSIQQFDAYGAYEQW